jgi:hypothetical protein
VIFKLFTMSDKTSTSKKTRTPRFTAEDIRQQQSQGTAYASSNLTSEERPPPTPSEKAEEAARKLGKPQLGKPLLGKPLLGKPQQKLKKK